jgi:Penicillin binding protein transpeptidase domain
VTDGAGNDEAGGGSRSPTQSAAEKRPHSVPGQHDEWWALDENGVWRRRRIAGYRRARLRRKLGVVGGSARDGTARLRRNLGVVGGSARDRMPRLRTKLVARIGAAGVIAVAVVLTLGLAGLFGSNKANKENTGGFHPTTTNPAQAARQTAAAFLAAWETGHIQKAASYTDHPDAALAALTSYRDSLDLRALHLAVRSATAQGRVAFSVDTTVGLPAITMPGATAHTTASSPGGRARNTAATATWSYASNLTAYAKHGAWWVRWNSGLVAPKLTAGEKFVTVPITPGANEVVDAAGGNLQDSGEPGLVNIGSAIEKRAPAGQGTPGIEVMLVGAGNKPVAGTTRTLSQPVAASMVKTTINPSVEAAAKSAVQAHADSSIVVIQPSTGEILAVANNDGGNDFALTARVAPGSTNKIITSTALFTTGLVRSPSQPVECPSQVDADGEVINNAGGESEPPGTPFLTDFAASCNNAFDRWYADMGPKTLAQTAQKYYGLNLPWDIGIGESSTYYATPSSASNAELALELFGQGRLETAPLAMASVAATVDAGSFRQPIVVAGQPQLAATPLPAKVHH